jgi:hypothetical protein
MKEVAGGKKNVHHGNFFFPARRPAAKDQVVGIPSSG